MKRFIISFMALFFSICIIAPISSLAAEDGVTAEDAWDYADDAWNYADSNRYMIEELQENSNGSGEKLDKIQESVDNIDVEQGIEDFVNKKNEELAEANKKESEENTEESDEGEQKKAPSTLSDAFLDVLNQAWGVMPELITSSVDDPVWQLTLEPSDQYNGTFYGIFVTIGYSLVLVFFAANLIETTIKYEIFTLKGGVQIFGRLIVSKVIIDLSGRICMFILNICDNICTKIMENATHVLKMETPTVFETQKNAVWPIGPILDFLEGLILAVPVLLIILIMLIAVVFVMLKLVLRSLELSLLMIVSPAFFACYSSEITKPYFKNFILTFLQCALQIVFMAVVYALSADWLTNVNSASTTEDVWAWFIKLIPNALIALAIAIMMIKPPKVLTSLVR